MFLSGVDVNVRSTDLRDYHGKKAAHYWDGETDVFNTPGPQWDGKLSYRRRSQRFVLPTGLLPRSRSQGQLSLDFTAVPPSPGLRGLDLQMRF
ncbi:hypothetical protein NHX12_002327 [Muraenolepis orangiensis]|uniref:Uncharacterized protein n=1 Tax=Muraenolepis orangiensis TaxID=630683 RepID=A0A9Q0IF62_9TELE|nr:hypothetical protein NHX12_002327 [Muraenolepis orangiensis]